MANTITITLGRNRTKEQAFSDAALVYGYKDTLVDTTYHMATYTIAEYKAAGTPNALLVSKGINNANITGVRINASSVEITYELSESTPNPQTEQEFGAMVWRNKCDEMDRRSVSIATKMRDELASTSTPTSVT